MAYQLLRLAIAVCCIASVMLSQHKPTYFRTEISSLPPQVEQVLPPYDAVGLSSLPRILAQDPEDDYWDPQFGPRFEQQTLIVQAIAVRGDTMVIGGFFQSFLGIPAYSLVLWDGKSWQPLFENGVQAPTGNPGSVTAIAISPEGDVIIAGEFSRAGGMQAPKLIRYNWQSIEPIPFPSNGSITALAYHNGQLYVGGAFADINGIPGTRNIARWDGSQWHAVGGGIDDGGVSVILSSGNNLYVGGTFRSVGGGRPALAVARWDGSQWHALGNGFRGETTGSLAQVYALAQLSTGEIVAGGDFARSGSATARYLALWDGTSWREFGPPDGPVTALLVDGSHVYVSGGFEKIGQQELFLMAQWDGSQWLPMGGDQLTATASILVRYRNSIIAGGNLEVAVTDNFSIRGVARWDGSVWSNFDGNRGNGLDGSVIDLAVDLEGNVYALGTFTTAGGINSPRIAHFTGQRWEAVTGIPFSQQATFQRITPYHNGTLAVASVFTLDGQSTPAVIQYDPATQTVTPLARLGGGLNTRSVFALLYDAERDRLICAGNYRTLNGDSVGGIAIYQNGQWQTLGGGISSGSIQDVAILPDGSIIAAGNFTSIGGTSAQSIARWDGSRWQALGDGLRQGTQTGTAYALLVQGTMLYAAGTFNQAGGVPCTNIAQWDVNTGTWQALAGGTNGPIYALALHGGQLVAAGNFSRAGDTTANSIARYNPSLQVWSRMGSGIQGSPATVYSLALSRGALCVGGNFGTAGGKFSRGFARWLEGILSVEQQTASSRHTSIELYPNPSTTAQQLTATVTFPTSGVAEIAAYTLDGRMLGVLWHGAVDAGVRQCSLQSGMLSSGTTLLVVRLNGRVVGSTLRVGIE